MRNILIAFAATFSFGGNAMATPLAVDNGLMTNVPNVGYSRIETVSFCLNEIGADKYQDLITDSDFQSFESCLLEMT